MSVAKYSTAFLIFSTYLALIDPKHINNQPIHFNIYDVFY